MQRLNNWSSYSCTYSLPADFHLFLFTAPKPDYYHSLHDGPVVSLQRSPFFKDVILCVGGWSFSIWKEGITVSFNANVMCSSLKQLTYMVFKWTGDYTVPQYFTICMVVLFVLYICSRVLFWVHVLPPNVWQLVTGLPAERRCFISQNKTAVSISGTC